jgi:divinyl protochlorophyllide a 8-vinyl-reductase
MARIGPNAIIRVVEALRESAGAETAARVLRHAGLARYLDELPAAMVDEREVTRLHASLRDLLGPDVAGRVAFSAGLKTGDYLLANRIPGAAQRLLRALPAWLASRLLLAAILRNAWTFAGSGIFRSSPQPRGARLSIAGCPVCAGQPGATSACSYYTGTFQRLFATLVKAGTRVVETECHASGVGACVFRVTW